MKPDWILDIVIVLVVGLFLYGLLAGNPIIGFVFIVISALLIVGNLAFGVTHLALEILMYHRDSE